MFCLGTHKRHKTKAYVVIMSRFYANDSQGRRRILEQFRWQGRRKCSVTEALGGRSCTNNSDHLHGRIKFSSFVYPNLLLWEIVMLCGYAQLILSSYLYWIAPEMGLFYVQKSILASRGTYFFHMNMRYQKWNRVLHFLFCLPL